MNDNFLKTKLRRVIRRYQWLGLWRKLAACWAIAALVGLALAWSQGALGWSSTLALPLLAALAAAVGTAVVLVHFSSAPDYRWVAQKIEQAHPELKGLLLTAVQQNLAAGAAPDYLQYRVLHEATARSQEQDWNKLVPTARLVTMQLLHLGAVACFAYALLCLRPVGIVRGESRGWLETDGIAVTPGDTSIEKGESLVVLARFGRTLPAAVSLVVRADATTPRTIPLVKSLADPVFGGSVPEVATNFTYRLEYGTQHTRDFKVSVYEHPRLVRSDADLSFPTYTKLSDKHIEDTRRVSAVEGTKLSLALQLNKPVASAKLVARDAKKTEIPLTVTADKAVATLSAFPLATSQTYDLRLVDADGRANKTSAPFVIDVQPNRPPELKLASPRGDVRPSALEEISFDGTVFDDFGSPAYGLAYTAPGGTTKFVELGHDTAAKEKRAFNYVMKLEDLGAKPDDLISWYLWADDIGPDGKTRRTSSDLSFAEVRPFDEIFRESQGMQSPEEQQQAQQQGQGNQTRRLTELQKQIINATWKLQRDGATPKYADDATVVHDSQKQALDQANEAMGNARSPRDAAMWDSATKEMQNALEKLADAAKSPAPLAQALVPEQAAYQALLKLQARETNVARSRGQRGSQGGQGQQASQRQIDQLDLTQSENRYETQRQAQAPQTNQRKEQLQVTNRLQELARRQQDINDRLKDLQTSLQEAKTPQEREDINRQLKRLEEEQRQMLADADEVRQRMDRPENQANMSDQRQQLDQTRQDIQRAADAAAQGSVAQALDAGTRAQRALQQMRDELRKENSSQFSDDLREMRSEARDLANQQTELSQKLDALGGSQHKTLGDSGDRQGLIDQLAQQKDRVNKLVDRATQVSQQAENTEPLLSRQLEDSLRKLSQDDTGTVKQARDELLNEGRFSLNDRLKQTIDREDGGKTLDLATELLRDGQLAAAGQAGQRARSQLDDLKRGVERAAESILGDDAEQLKLAQSELDQLTDQLKREIAQAGQTGAQPSGQPGQAGARGGRGDPSQPGAQSGEATQSPSETAAADGQQPGRRPGQGGQQPGQQPGQGERGLANADQQAGQNGRGGQQPGDTPASANQANGGRGANGQPRDGAPSGQPGQQGQAGRGGAQLAGGRGARNGQQGGGNRGGIDLNNLLNGGTDNGGGGGSINGGPIAGDNFGPWMDRLSDVEQLLDSPDLRNAIATARERARLVRRDAVQARTKPDWAVVQSDVLKPLVEVRNRVAEELARRDTKDSLAPIDRDPVPNRFADSVRRYYEELGKDKPNAEAVR